jgi:hypothetical protein
MTTPAEELRAAARILRQLAEAAQRDLETADYWKPYAPATAWRDGHVNGFGGVSSDLVAVLPPTAALALADWLDSVAGRARLDGGEWVGADLHHALAVARQIAATHPTKETP